MVSRRRLLSVVLVSAVVFALVLPAVGLSAAPPPVSTSPAGERPPTPGPALASVQPQHSGNGPFGPDPAADSYFWVDSGANLDQYLFRDEGPIAFTIPVDRVVGRTDANGYLLEPQKLIDHGVLSGKAQLQLLVWDVDEDYTGTTYQPESDKVYLNGHYIGELSGANDTWSLTRLQFDIRYLKFAIPSCHEYGDAAGQDYLSECSASPTTANNEFRIDIDTTNTDLVWAVELDWAALSFEAARPILFVHGKGGSEDGSQSCTVSGGGGGCTYWDKRDDQYWFDFRGHISAAGFMTAITENFLGGEVSMQENARRLKPLVQDVKDRYGVDRINLVGHSKGGLDSRAYVSDHKLNDQNDVAALVTLSSPHHGSYLADVGGSLPEFVLGWIGYASTPAMQNVSEKYMADTFNPTHPARENVRYYSVAADSGQDYWYGRDIPNWQVDALPEASQRAAAAWGWLFLYHFGAQKGDNDFMVTVNSTRWSGIPNHTGANSEFVGSYALNHHSVRAAMQHVGQEDTSISNKVMEALDIYSSGSAAAAALPAASPATGAAPTAMGSISGTVLQGQTVNRVVGLEAGSSASFLLLWNSGELSMNLVDPLGHVITPSTGDPNTSYAEDRSGALLGEFFVAAKAIQYDLTAPAVGSWQVQITGASGVPGGGANWLLLTAEDSALTASLQSDAPWRRVGEKVTLSAALTQAGLPVLGSSITASVIAPSHSIQTLSMYDDGTHGDVTPGDGVYVNSFVGNELGIYRLSISASGVSGAGIPYQRSATTEVQFGSGTASFGAGFSDQGVDANGNGLYDLIRVVVPLTVNTAGEYMVSGILVDSLGRELASSNMASNLSSGSQTLALDFDARAIWAAGGEGSFTLADLRLYDNQSTALPIQVDYRSSAYTTASYSRDSLEHSTLGLTHNNTDYGVDNNGNGRYDELVVDIETNIEIAGSYSWNARLVDQSGYEFGWDSGSGVLAAGLNRLLFRFDGQAINAHHTDGPYYLKDLAVWGDGGYLSVIDAATTSAYLYTQFELVPRKLYLPLVTRNYRPSSTLIVNGDFEQGAGVGWQESSSNGWPLVLNSSYLPLAPHGGSWAAWLGGDDNEISVLYQQVALPAGSPTLRFWYQIRSDDACGYDFGGVVVNGTVADIFDLCTSAGTSNWIQRSVNLAAWAGKSVQLEIRAETDVSTPSSLYIDDVTVGSTLAASRSETPESLLLAEQTAASKARVLALPTGQADRATLPGVFGGR